MPFLDFDGLRRFKEKLDAKFGNPIEALLSWKPSSNGSAGQFLRSNGDGTTSWQGVATEQEIASAVDDWMDENIAPNTAITLDSSLTATNAAAQAAAAGNMVIVADTQPSAETNKVWINKTPNEEVIVPTVADLNAAIAGKYSTFSNYSEKTVSIPDTTDYPNHGTVKIYGSDMSFGNAELRNEANMLKAPDSFGTLYGCPYKLHGSVFEMNGVKAADTQLRYFQMFNVNVNIPINTEIKVLIKATAPINGMTSDAFLTFYGANNESQAVYIITNSTSTSYTRTLTMNHAVTRISMSIEIPSAEATFDHLKVWFGVFHSGVTTIDTSMSVQEGSTSEYTNEAISGWGAIDFGAYDGSLLCDVEDLKEYIDTRTPSITMTYTTPEDFGAAGNNTADDSAALQSCIAYAISTKTPMKAYGTYAISQPLIIDGNLSNIEINRLRPSFNDYAIKFSGVRNRLTVNDILNTTGGGGILIKPITSDYIENNDFVFGRINVASGDAIHMECLNNGVQSLIYNTFHVNELSSTSGNCIYAENGFGENKWYGGKLSTASGWGIYFKSHMFSKMYGFSMEQDCYAGICLDNSSHNSFIGFRVIEMMSKKTDSTDRGTVLKFLRRSAYVGNYFHTTDDLYGESIDISQSGLITDVATWNIINQASSSIAETSIGIQSAVQHTYIGGNVLHAPRRCGTRMIIKPERIVCVPDNASRININGDFDMSAAPFEGQYSMMVVGSDANITLSPSYCSAGTNDFKIINKGSNTISVADCHGVPFVSSSDDGEFRFHCYADLDSVYKGSLASSTDLPGWWNGENDVWFVEHNGDTIAEIHLQPFYKSVGETEHVSGELIQSGTWDTSDSGVATVENGTITAVSTGTAAISLTSNGVVERWVIKVMSTS